MQPIVALKGFFNCYLLIIVDFCSKMLEILQGYRFTGAINLIRRFQLPRLWISFSYPNVISDILKPSLLVTDSPAACVFEVNMSIHINSPIKFMEWIRVTVRPELKLNELNELYLLITIQLISFNFHTLVWFRMLVNIFLLDGWTILKCTKSCL